MDKQLDYQYASMFKFRKEKHCRDANGVLPTQLNTVQVVQPEQEWSEETVEGGDSVKKAAGKLMAQVSLSLFTLLCHPLQLQHLTLSHTNCYRPSFQVLKSGKVLSPFCGGPQKYCDAGDHTRAIKGQVLAKFENKTKNAEIEVTAEKILLGAIFQWTGVCALTRSVCTTFVNLLFHTAHSGMQVVIVLGKLPVPWQLLESRMPWSDSFTSTDLLGSLNSLSEGILTLVRGSQTMHL